MGRAGMPWFWGEMPEIGLESNWYASSTEKESGSFTARTDSWLGGGGGLRSIPHSPPYPGILPLSSPKQPHGFFKHESTNSHSAFVEGSPSTPRLALMFVWFVFDAPKTVVVTPASFNAFPKRTACAVTSG